MKLIYISHWRFPSEKTMSPLIMKTCEMFARRGFEVELWIPWRYNPSFSALDPFLYHKIEKNFSIRRLPAADFTKILPGKFWFFLMLLTFNLSVGAYAFVKRKRKDLIFYLHDERDAILLPLFGRPIFVEIHDFYKSGLNRLNHYVFSRLRGFIVTNHHKINTLSKEFSVPAEKMLHQPNGVDVAMFEISLTKEEARVKLSLPERGKIILYAGHLFSWKGVDTLYAASFYLPGNETVYLVGGTDEDIAKYREKVRNDRIANVKIIGRRPHEEIPLWLKAADVLVLPNTAKEDVSKFETSPVKLFEYLASGTPIVVSNLPSVRNIADETSVSFFEPDDPVSLAREIRAVLQYTEVVRRKAEFGKNEAKKYSWENRERNIERFLCSRLREDLNFSKVLLLGDDSRATLAIARSLGRHGIKIVLGTQEKHSSAAYSSFVSKILKFPSNSDDLDNWKNKLKEVLETERFDLIIPEVERTAAPLAECRDFPQAEKFALPDKEGFEIAFSKYRTWETAKKLDIPVPQSVLIKNRGDLEYFLGQPKISFPLIMKPDSSKKWFNGYRLDFSVSAITGPDELKRAARILDFIPIVLQELITGKGVGQEFLCKNGKILLAFQHERIHEPEGSGGSTYRKSVSLHPDMLECSKRILAELKWNGPIMVEYRWNPKTGHFALLELNGRFWGSLPLAVESGADFPYLLFEMLARKNPILRTEYKKNVYSRNIINDIRWMAKKKTSVFWIILSFFKSLGRLILGKEHWDELTWDDPRPAIAQFIFLLRSVLASAEHRWFCRKILRNDIEKTKEQIKYLLKANPSILFVCRGNIIRSPFAAEYARQKKELKGYAISSGGVYEKPGRLAHPFAVCIAGENGIKIKDHRSSTVTLEDVKRTGVIFCMSSKEYEIIDSYSEAGGKLFMLSSILGQCEIADPLGHPPEEFEETYMLIKNAIDELAKI